ncbi:MAG: hypothetical protein JXA09_07790 [Anaerolineae bacterium]|nr:hypothetical protein [Anaerolineae bacterium]
MIEGTPAREERCFYVYNGEYLALTVADAPGTLRSSAPPPPAGARPPAHPFLDAQAHDPASEDELASILARCADFDAYLAALVEAGYDLAALRRSRLPGGARLLDGARPIGVLWPEGGPFSCLWWQPAPGCLEFDHALVTAYDRDRALDLLDALRATATLPELLDALRAAGIAWG